METLHRLQQLLWIHFAHCSFSIKFKPIRRNFSPNVVVLVCREKTQTVLWTSGCYLSDGGYLEGSSHTWSSSTRHQSLPWICPLSPRARNVSFMQIQNTPNTQNTPISLDMFYVSMGSACKQIEAFLTSLKTSQLCQTALA